MALPVPPVAVVYHNRFVPVAVRGQQLHSGNMLQVLLLWEQRSMAFTVTATCELTVAESVRNCYKMLYLRQGLAVGLATD